MPDGGNHTLLRAQRAPGLSVSRLVVGRPVGEVAELLPRLFNLCRAAQGAAVDAALGRPVSTHDIGQEILRDHLLKFHVTWPAFFGCPPSALPQGWAEGSPALRQAVFGPTRQAPASYAEFVDFLQSDSGYAPVLRKIDGCFGTGEAVAEGIAPVSAHTMWSGQIVDNSVASRVAQHPVMKSIADVRGRGPLWRAAARLFDIVGILDGEMAPIVAVEPGAAIVTAARGSYAVRLSWDGDTITAFDRITPTDHLLAKDGVLDRSLATLPAYKAGLGPLLLSILDPCSPVRLQEVAHA